MIRVIALLVLFATNNSWGEVAAPDVTQSQLDAAVAHITAVLPADDPKRVALLKSYADTSAALQSFEQFNEQRESFALSRANGVKQAEAIEEKLAEYQNAPPREYTVARTLSLSDLEDKLQSLKSEEEDKKDQLADITTTIDALPNRPEEIRARVTVLTGLAAELDTRLGTMNKKGASGSSDEAAYWLALAESASAEAEKKALEEELLSLPMRRELLKAQQDQASYEITELDKRALALTLRLSELRAGEAAKAQAAAELVLAGTVGKHDLVRQLAKKNVVLTRTFSTRNQDIESADEQNTKFSSTADQLQTDLMSMEQKLKLLGMSSAVGAILREHQAQLPTHSEMARKISANTDDIQASSLLQIELEDERRHLRNRSDYIDELTLGLAPAVVEEVREDLDDLARTRRKLLRSAVDLENSYAQSLGDLDFTLRKHADVIDKYRHFISARLLWIPTRDSFGLFRGDGADIFKQFRDVFVPARWLTVLGNLAAELVAQPLTGALLLVVLVLVYYSPRLKQQLADTGKHVGYVRSDNFASTLQALGLSLLMSIKWPLLLLTSAWLFEMQTEEPELATALYVPMARAAFYFWGLEILRIALLPQGLVDKHFRWPTSRVSLIGRQLVILELTLLPAAFLVGFFVGLSPRDVGGPMGTIAVVLMLYSIAHFFNHLPEFVQTKMQMMLSDSVAAERPLWSKLVRKLLYWIPITAILAVIFGYTFTAIEIALLLVRTFVLLSFILILHELGLRWLGLTQSRMAFKLRQEQARASQQESEISLEDELLENDPELLSDEGKKLVNLLTLFGGLLGVWLIWSEVVPALGILDSVILWHQTAVIDGLEVADPITLADLSRAVMLAIVGWIALRRIPGLLEILLRQRANVSAASAYAVTRVFQYAATALLVVIVAGSLGGSWSSMQWAVAALSLGIGFGLQEIVANFISGLIILFEQPIRVGDVVTVGDISGTVTRIQMRATTVRDFDRRELLVPNKQFITSELLNWTLSDSVTRRLVQVGVAYGTDMDQALEVVTKVARNHPLVLADPESMITFDEFGESSLLISLRYFIENLDQRIKVDSELRLEISRRFKDAGIVVAFPQRDIHIDSAQPLEVRMVSGTPSTPISHE